MKEFDVIISETMERKVTVNAENSHDAEEQAELEWDQGKHVLDYNDFKHSNFTTVAERERQLTVLLVEPMKPPKEVQMPDTLQALQKAVGGRIETVSPFDDAVVIIGSQGAKIHDLQLNRGLYDKNGELEDIISGTFIVAGVGEETFESLSPELMEKYKEHFEIPEKFYYLAGQIIVQKVEPPKDKDLIKKATQPER